jgi:hypothetical protein
MIVPIPYVHLGIGLIATVLSIPLILRKVPMNHVYGFRVSKAFISNNNWYAVNAYGGKLLLAFGLFLLIFGSLSRDLAPQPTSLWAPVFLVIPFLAIVPVIILVTVYARHLPDGGIL